MALKIAEVQSRMGDIAEAIELLRGILPRVKKLPDAWRVRLLLRLAALQSRGGHFCQADSLFSEGLREVRSGRVRLDREEFLYFLGEHADMKAFVGQYEQAIKLCEEGIRLAGRRRDFATRDVLLNLLATRANVALRTFRLEDAARDFETALAMAEAIGSLGNRATILNNLGIVYSQLDRYSDAIRSFQEARSTCLSLDEGPSLLFVHGNLGLLHAKTGNFVAMDKVFSELDRIAPVRSSQFRTKGKPFRTGSRAEMFVLHHRGLSLLNRGRYAEARALLEDAINRAHDIGDRFVAVYDELYCAEANIFEGKYSQANSELKRLSQPENGERVRLMALSRLAFLAALTARPDEAREAQASHRELSFVRPVPFLDAWDEIFFGWSLSLNGERNSARQLLGHAEAYFSKNRLRPAASLASWVRAESFLLEGNEDEARRVLRETSSHSDFTAVLRPLLEGRLLVGRGTGESQWAQAADSLAEAGAALLGNPLPEWSSRLDALRAVFLAVDDSAEEVSDVGIERRHQDLVSDFPAEVKEAYRETPSWMVWTRGFDYASVLQWTKRIASRGKKVTDRQLLERKGGGSSHRTRELDRGGSINVRPRDRLVLRSPAMRKLAGRLDRLRRTDLPVVLHGETGTGKELIARTIHLESSRSSGPFQVLDCSTIPVGLLETELFGARAGAFTDLDKDRPGLLARTCGGTLLIDEIADVSSDMQAKLLRCVSEGVIRPVGSEEEMKVDLRLLISTTRDLATEVQEGRMRADLFHRIQVVVVRVPPLRQRSEDMKDLVEIFLQEGDGPAPRVDAAVFELLRKYKWPGNVRELRNLLLRLRMENPVTISEELLAKVLADSTTTSLLPDRLLADKPLSVLKDHVERDYIRYHFHRLEGDMAALSRLLGISMKHCYRRLKKIGIRVKEARNQHRRSTKRP